MTWLVEGTMYHTGEARIPMASRRDKVEKSVDTVVPEPGVTLDTRLFSQDIVVLALEVANDLGEAVV